VSHHCNRADHAKKGIAQEAGPTSHDPPHPEGRYLRKGVWDVFLVRKQSQAAPVGLGPPLARKEGGGGGRCA